MSEWDEDGMCSLHLPYHSLLFVDFSPNATIIVCVYVITKME